MMIFLMLEGQISRRDGFIRFATRVSWLLGCFLNDSLLLSRASDVAMWNQQFNRDSEMAMIVKVES